MFLFQYSTYSFCFMGRAIYLPYMQITSSRFGVSYIIIIGIFVLCLLFGVSSYNGLVRQNEQVTTQWAQVEAQYQRRFDLIPNLVASVQGSMKQETEIFTVIANARQGYAGATSIDEKAQAARSLDSALSRLLVISENYPVLKSNEAVQSLMSQLEGTENRISVERMRYNDEVNAYNIKVKTFPGNLFASVFGFAPKSTFESDNNAEKVPTVKLK